VTNVINNDDICHNFNIWGLHNKYQIFGLALSGMSPCFR